MEEQVKLQIVDKLKFVRGLIDSRAFDAVRGFLSTEIGKIICDNASIQLCIRENYINVYYKGCSVLKYSPLETTNRYLIHDKYLDGGDRDTYVSLDLAGNNDSKKMLLLLSSLDKSLNKYIVGEKKHLASYISSAGQKPFLLDLEVAFIRKRDQEEKAKSAGNRDYIADRIDMACIARIDNKATLQLVEVKIDTDSRLRSSIQGGQEVLIQMKHYRSFIKDQEQNIQESYRMIADNYLKLNLLSKFPNASEALDMLQEFRVSGRVDLEPYLLIIRTKENMKGKYGDHAQLLTDELIKNGYKPPLLWDAV